MAEQSSMKVNPVIALYKDGKLEDIQVNPQEVTVAAGETATVKTAPIVVPDEEDLTMYEVKAFLLGGDAYTTPLRTSKQLEAWEFPNLALDAVATASSEENQQQSEGADHSIKNVNDGK